MKIRAIKSTSFNEITGYCSFIIFLDHCNFRCGYCHNHRLLFPEKYNLPEIPQEKVIENLDFYRDLIDFVVITGGEPTLHGKDLIKLMETIKESGFKTAIETNGSNPDIIEYLIDNKLIDFVSMDVKGKLEDYNKIARVDVNIESVKNTIDILIDSNILYEFNTTLVPLYVKLDNFDDIVKQIYGAKRYCLQQFSNEDTLDPMFRSVKPYDPNIIKKFYLIAKKYIPKVIIKNIIID